MTTATARRVLRSPILVFMAGLVAGAALLFAVLWLRGTFEHAASVEPVQHRRPLANWYTGDVHTHAAGDADVVGHPRCRQDLPRSATDRDCARHLVRLLLQAANNNDVQWLIMSEHGPWLGGVFSYDVEEGGRQWDLLRAAADELSLDAELGVRALMGEELGSAPPISFYGHFNAYSVSSYVKNTRDKVSDAEYIADVVEAGGWGGINHPHQGGNGWDCWTETDAPRCSEVATDFASNILDPAEAQGGFVALELTNGGRSPPDETLDQWDELLHRGYEVWAVGASDAHTWSRGADSYRHVQGHPEEHRVGASVTFAYVENLPSPGVGYDSTDPEDPVRRAILAGRTVASNAGFATAQVGDVQPGGTLTLPATGDAEVEVLVRWEQGFASDEPPETITLVLGRVDPECVAPCPEIIRSAPAPPAAPGAEYGELLLTMTVPAHWTHAFLRVEVLRSVGDDDRRWGAFTSPVFLVRG